MKSLFGLKTSERAEVVFTINCLRQRVMAKIQTTLFGKWESKAPFFGKVTESESRSEYYSVVKALWQLDGSHDHKRFLKKVQKLWSEKYSKDSGAREELCQRAGTGH